MDKPKDFYQLLGVPRDASVTAIKRAIRRLARSIDRERAAEEKKDSLAAQLQAAYETLTDAERRRSYDDQLGHHRRAAAAIDTSLVVRGPAGDLRRPYTPTSLVAEVVMSSADAVRGKLLPFEVPVSATCSACDGTGGRFLDCEWCMGEGKVARRLPVPVHVPPGTRDGAVFEVRTGDPALPVVLLTIHISERS
jgi:DnaJ-class molecular chaperone